MTPDEKRDRRKARQEIMRQAKKIATRRMGLFATNAQILAAARNLTDRFFTQADHVPTTVQPLECSTPNN